MSHPQDPSTNRTHEAFEYMFLELPYDLPNHSFMVREELAQLNRLGSEGWQVVMSIPKDEGQRRPQGYVLMRRKN